MLGVLANLARGSSRGLAPRGARTMKLSPREVDHMRITQAGHLAQRRLARGRRLNHPEAVALIASQMLEMIRDGEPVASLMTVGQQLLGRRQVMPGVSSMVNEVQVEGTFPDGTKLLTIHSPIAALDGDMELALQGSFLPVPPLSAFGDGGDADLIPGEMIMADAAGIELNAGRELIEVGVTNSGDRPIQVGSHYHFLETNAALVFDRAAAYGKRLNVPAGSSVRFEPGDSKTVTLVAIAGAKRVVSGNLLTDGVASAERLPASKTLMSPRKSPLCRWNVRPGATGTSRSPARSVREAQQHGAPHSVK